jgi:hypothetical protein
MHLLQNAETIDRVVEQGRLLLEALHAKNVNDPSRREAEFLRGHLVGWCSTLHTLYHDGAGEILDRVRTTTRLPVPVGNSHCCRTVSIGCECSTQGACRWN